MTHKIRLLLVDDSLLFREALARSLSHEPMIEILPTASDPFDAIAKIKKYHPSLIISDIEMPGMNGIEFVARLMKEVSIPIITLSSRDDLKSNALQAGAAAFMAKPVAGSVQEVQDFMIRLITLILQLGSSKREIKLQRNDAVKGKLIAIGASTGGTEAITQLLSKLPSNCPPILITQHIPEGFSKMFAERLDQILPMKVKEAANGDAIRHGTVLIAPGNKHMSMKCIDNQYIITCRAGDKVNGHCPSVDVLFHSVADTVGPNAIGVLLTGMGKDGAEGLLHMRQAGAFTIGQDQQSSVVYGMPKIAYDIGAVAKQLPLQRIANEILLHV